METGPGPARMIRRLTGKPGPAGKHANREPLPPLATP